jgi:hypothetical protein
VKIVIQLLLILGFPLCAITLNEVTGGGLEGSSIWNSAFQILVITPVISFPQLILGLLYLLKAISKPTYLGGLLTGHAWLGGFVTLLIVSPPSGNVDSPWFLYFPVCFVLVPLGTLIGYMVNKYWLSKRAV